ncbi:hypothetical protein WR25_15883 [Diploscapter pachys]|uniref:Uncharacterized protein n=1 Tax=Diploscapter pachys TaxID=2018661 RepID=A0A2A2LHH7_9BILA|nr:hypothetical protein WR25_15883 [Diploscapter pachys]
MTDSKATEPSRLTRCVKQSFFARDAPFAFDSPQIFSTSADGTVIYALKVEIHLSVESETREIVSVLSARHISQQHVQTGKSLTYELDPDIELLELRSIVDFYPLYGKFGVLMTFNYDRSEVRQLLLWLDETREAAELVGIKTITLGGLAGIPNMGMGHRVHGEILLVGPSNRERHRSIAAYLLPMDPLQPHYVRDLQPHLTQFIAFLHSNGQQSVCLFDRGVFIKDNCLYFLMKCRHDPNIVTGFMGKTDLLAGVSGRRRLTHSIFKLDDSEVELVVLMKISFDEVFRFSELFSVRDIIQLAHCDRMIYFAMSRPDYESMQTLYWQAKYLVGKCTLKALAWLLSFFMWSQKFDGGWGVRFYLWVLETLFGRQMLPSMIPEPVRRLYSLKLTSLKWKVVDHSFTCSHPLTGSDKSIYTVMDCDQKGGLVVADMPDTYGRVEENDEKLQYSAVSYICPTTSPLALARIAEHAAYRWYPAFERSDLLRRSLGIVDWKKSLF